MDWQLVGCMHPYSQTLQRHQFAFQEDKYFHTPKRRKYFNFFVRLTSKKKLRKKTRKYYINA